MKEPTPETSEASETSETAVSLSRQKWGWLVTREDKRTFPRDPEITLNFAASQATHSTAHKERSKAAELPLSFFPAHPRLLMAKGKQGSKWPSRGTPPEAAETGFRPPTRTD